MRLDPVNKGPGYPLLAILLFTSLCYRVNTGNGLQWSMPNTSSKDLDFIFSTNSVRGFRGSSILTFNKTDLVASFKFLAVDESLPTPCKDWLRVPSPADGALKGPDFASLISSFKLYGMAPVEWWKRFEKLDRHCQSLLNISLAEDLWETCHFLGQTETIRMLMKCVSVFLVCAFIDFR